MKIHCLLAALALLISPWAAGAEEFQPIVPRTEQQNEECRQAPVYVWIEVVNVEEPVGFVTGQLHDDDPDRWLVGKQRIDRERWVAKTGQTDLCFVLPGPGTYAIAVYHDKNANRKLDTTWLGVPEEPVGASNNPGPGLGPPSYDEVAFDVPEGGRTIRIALYEW